MANPSLRPSGPPTVPDLQISQSLKLPHRRPTWLLQDSDCEFRKTQCSNPPAFHYCVSGTFITHTCTLAIGFSLSFLTCRLYPRQNLFVPINPFKSAPPRLTFRLHLPFSNLLTTPAIHLQYLLLHRKRSYSRRPQSFQSRYPLASTILANLRL